MKKLLVLFGLTIAGTICASAQVAAGGTYRLEQSVIASGGGTSADASGSVFRLDSTIGEAVAGTTSTTSPFVVRGGFLTPQVLAPTAAGVTISGRALTAGGKGIRNVRVTLTTADGATQTTLTGISGSYSFNAVAAGQTVIVQAAAKRFSFNEPTQILNLNAEASGIDFIGSGAEIFIQ